MKKEPLSLIAVKTLLAVIIFTGVGTIIVGGVIIFDRLNLENYKYQSIKSYVKTGKFLISEENIVKIANETKEAKEFLKLYPNAELSKDFWGLCYGHIHYSYKECGEWRYMWDVNYTTKFNGDNFILKIVVDPTDGKVYNKSLGCRKSGFRGIKYSNNKTKSIFDLFNDKGFCNVRKNLSSGWQIYRDEEYGIEIEYPENWQIRKFFPGRTAHLEQEKRPKLFSFVSPEIDLLGKEDGINIYIDPSGFSACPPIVDCINFKCSDTEVDNIKAIVRTKEGIKEIFLCKSNNYFRFFTTLQQEKVFDQILSTFKFTEKDGI